MARADDQPQWPHAWMGAFLDRLSETGNVKKAARKARVSRQRAYLVRTENEAFRQAWDEALACAVTVELEPEALRRAVSGTLEPVYYQGKKVGSVRRYSDTPLIFLLKAHAPEKYSERLRGRFCIPSLPTYLEVGLFFENERDSFARQRIVFDDEDLCHFAARVFASIQPHQAPVELLPR